MPTSHALTTVRTELPGGTSYWTDLTGNWTNGIPTIEDDAIFDRSFEYPISIGPFPGMTSITDAFAKNLIFKQPDAALRFKLTTTGTSKGLLIGDNGSISVDQNAFGAVFDVPIVLGSSGAESTYLFKPASGINGSLRFNKQIRGGSGGASGDKTLVVESGNVFLNSGVHDGGASSVSIAVRNNGDLSLSGQSTFTGDIHIQNGNLRLSGNSIPSTCNLSVENSGLYFGGSNSAGKLSLLEDSSLFLSMSAGVSFSDSSDLAWNGVLTISGLENFGSIRFGTNEHGLTGEQLSLIQGNGYGAASLNSQGYLVFENLPGPSVPEPRAMGLFGLVVVSFAAFSRRKSKPRCL